MSLVRRMSVLVAALAVTAAVATGCTEANGTNGKDYVAGDGVVIEIPENDRGKPVEISGETLSGDQLDLADSRGSVVVVNVWWSGCPPCRVEAPMLVEASDELPGGGTIVGIDIRDSSKDNALAFERSFDVPYPSLYDPGSQQLLNFPAPFNPRDMPSTLVLDRQGRVAALVRGQLPSKLTLVELVQKVAAEDGQGDG
jgi:thiol-disulfide isomerase/thioredoxin